jgi:hypothetical protein
MRNIISVKADKKVAFCVFTRMLLLPMILFPLFVNPGKGVCISKIDDHEKQVRDFVAAFNARDLAKMLELVDDKIQWLSINGATISIETEGKAALKASMEKYFSECSTCKSSLEWVQTAGSRITAREIAHWTSKSGPKEQSSLSVYEFQGDKIIRVYYFPAEREISPKK